MTKTAQLTTCLWFNGNGREAAEFYVAHFPDSRMVSTWVTPVETPGNEPHTEVTIDFEIFGQKFIALNGGPQFPHSEAVSFVIPCTDQSEVDHYWDLLTSDGGKEGQCGWLTDRFGVSWQVVPDGISEFLGGPDDAGRARATAAMLEMTKLDLAALKAAYVGTL